MVRGYFAMLMVILFALQLQLQNSLQLPHTNLAMYQSSRVRNHNSILFAGTRHFTEYDLPSLGKVLLGSCLAILVSFPLPSLAERMPLSEFNTRSLEERGQVERGRFPNFTNSYKLLIETALAQGGAADDSFLFPDYDEDLGNISSLFSSEEWAANTAENVIAARHKSVEDEIPSSPQLNVLDDVLLDYTEPADTPNSEFSVRNIFSDRKVVHPENVGLPSPTQIDIIDEIIPSQINYHHINPLPQILSVKSYPGSQFLEYERKLGFQNAWKNRLDEILGDNLKHYPSEEVEEKNFEDVRQEPWHYHPDMPDMASSFLPLLPAALIVLGMSMYQYFKARNSSQDTLPLQYDIDAIERYFSMRPDVVLARSLEIAVEFFVIALESFLNRIAYALVQSDKAKTELSKVRAKELRESITRMGPAFIKLGQALSSRSDLVDESTMVELSLLQDALPFFPNDVAHESIRKELGMYPEKLFDWYSENPVAAASLGQVYKARIDGQLVAVKVQRPGLVHCIALDCYILRNMVRLFSGLSALPGIHFRTDLVGVVDEYSSRLFEELDYKTELRNMRKFQRLYGHLEGIYIPKVYDQYSSRRVIVIEWIEGVKLVDEKAKVKPEDLPLLQVGIQCTLTQLLDKGFLHADPHGGNLLKTPSGKLAYIDFGLVSDIPTSVMDTIICATVHLMNRAYPALAADFPGLALMSADDAQRDLPEFTTALKNAFDPIMLDLRAKLDSAQDEGGCFPSIPLAKIIDKIFSLAQKFNFVIPPYFLSNLRALGELEGLAMSADSNFNLVGVIYPYVTRRLLTDPSPRLRYALREFIIDSNGMPRWDVIDTLLRDASLLNNSIRESSVQKLNRPSTAEIGIDFMISKEGAFLRNILVLQMMDDISVRVNRIIDRFESALTRIFGLPRVQSKRPNLKGNPSIRESRRRFRQLLAFRPLARPAVTFRFSILVSNILVRLGFEIIWRSTSRLALDIFKSFKKIGDVLGKKEKSSSNLSGMTKSDKQSIQKS